MNFLFRIKPKLLIRALFGFMVILAFPRALMAENQEIAEPEVLESPASTLPQAPSHSTDSLKTKKVSQENVIKTSSDSSQVRGGLSTPFPQRPMPDESDESDEEMEVLEAETEAKRKLPSPTQDIIEKSDETFTVKNDFSVMIDTTQSKNVGKSLWAALGLSAVLPGSGEYYLKDKTASKKFILTEVGFWGVYWIAILARDSYLQSSRQYARSYAGLQNDKPTDELLTAMTQYRSYQEVHHCKCSYEQVQILSGQREGEYDIPDVEENHWDFGSAAVAENTENWKTFIATTKNFGRAKVVATWAIGGLLLGRVVSTLNTLHIYRTTSVKGLVQGSKSNDLKVAKAHVKRSPSKEEQPFSSFQFLVVPEIGVGHTGAHLKLMF